MELDGKEIKENEQLTDAQLTELHQQYQALWDKLKKDNYKTDHQFMEVLYEEPDNIQNYEAAFFTYQIRKDTGDNQFDQLNIILNNKPTFTISQMNSCLRSVTTRIWMQFIKRLRKRLNLGSRHINVKSCYSYGRATKCG